MLYVLYWIAGIYGIGYIACFAILMMMAKEWSAIPEALEYAFLWPQLIYDMIKYR